jgi:phosphate-selective porin
MRAGAALALAIAHSVMAAPLESGEEPDTSGVAKYPSARFHGSLFGDWADVRRETVAEDDVRIRDSEIRKAEFIVSGSLSRQLAYKVQIDAADGEFDYKDIYLEYSRGPLTVLGGEFKPVSTLTNPSTSVLLELSEVEKTVATSDRQLGIGVSSKGSNWGLSAAVFKDSIGPAGVKSETYSARLTTAPILGPGRVLYFGGGWRLRKPDRTNPNLDYDGGSVLHLDDTSIRTDGIGDQDVLLNLEATGVRGPVSVESQCMSLRVFSNARSAEFNVPRHIEGCYVMAAWILTGQARRFERDRFAAMDVANGVPGGGGVWQTVLRYDTIDYAGGSAPAKQSNWTMGLNWYMSDYVRIAAQYVHGEFTGSPRSRGTVDALGVRCMITW